MASGQRFIAIHWDDSLPPAEAAKKAGATAAPRTRTNAIEFNCLTDPAMRSGASTARSEKIHGKGCPVVEDALPSGTQFQQILVEIKGQPDD